MKDLNAQLTRLEEALRSRCDTSPVREYSHHGEWHLTFEILADRVYEDDVLLSDDEAQLARDVAAFWQDDFYGPKALFAAETLAAAGPRDANGRYPRRLFTLEYCCRTSAGLKAALAGVLELPSYDGTWDGFRRALGGAPFPALGLG